jgi:enoyl-CoA hydratase
MWVDDCVDLTADHFVTTITLNEPDKLNRLSGRMQLALKSALEHARTSGARVVVIRGEGRAFSTGYDLDPRSPARDSYLHDADIEADRAGLANTARMWREIRDFPLPVISQISGYCLSGGTDLMLATDIAIAAEDASIGMPNTRSLGITLMLPVWTWMIGPMRAKLMAFTGDSISGAQAAEWGLVAWAVPANRLPSAVASLAERIAQLPPDIVHAAKRSLNTAFDTAGLAQAIAGTVEIDTVAHFTPVVRQFWERIDSVGLKAALEERDGSFRETTFLDAFLGPR